LYLAEGEHSKQHTESRTAYFTSSQVAQLCGYISSAFMRTWCNRSFQNPLRRFHKIVSPYIATGGIFLQYAVISHCC